MSLLAALVFGVLIGAGVYLLTRGDITKLVAGTLLMANAALLLLVSAGFRTRVGGLADPLVQALALTSVVINFATTVLLMRVMVAVESTHDTLQTEDLVRAETRDLRSGDGGEQP